MVLHVPPVQLQYQLAIEDETFVVRPAVRALAIEQSLVPTAARFNIAHANQWLWIHRARLSFIFNVTFPGVLASQVGFSIPGHYGVSCKRIRRYSICPRSPSSPIGPEGGTRRALSSNSSLQVQYASAPLTWITISFQS